MRPSFEQEKQMIEKAVSEFPAEFCLRAFPGKRFRANAGASYYSDAAGAVVVYLDIWEQQREAWSCFTKDTLANIRREIR